MHLKWHFGALDYSQMLKERGILAKHVGWGRVVSEVDRKLKKIPKMKLQIIFLGRLALQRISKQQEVRSFGTCKCWSEICPIHAFFIRNISTLDRAPCFLRI